MSALLGDPVDIAVVDYGMGNRRSVEKASVHLGASACVTSDAGRLRAAAGLVVPGVGSFPRAMQRLRELGLDELLLERVASGTPVLGVCLGMQLAFERSSEHGGAPRLGIIPGEVRELRADGLKLPHIGWSEVSVRGSSPLIEGLPERCAFYHVHSFAVMPERAENVLAVAEYGSTFVSAVHSGSFYGVQVHPEKSPAAGLRLLPNLAPLCP